MHNFLYLSDTAARDAARHILGLPGHADQTCDRLTWTFVNMDGLEPVHGAIVER